MFDAAALFAASPRQRGVEGHAINPRRLPRFAAKGGDGQPELQQHVLKQIVLILRRGAAADNFQHQPKMRVQPSAKDGFLFVGGH